MDLPIGIAEVPEIDVLTFKVAGIVEQSLRKLSTATEVYMRNCLHERRLSLWKIYPLT